MTSPYYLSGSGEGSTATLATRPQIPKLVLESMDGSERIPLDGTEGFIRMPGSTGLEMPPMEIISSAIPGVAGGTLTDVRVDERPVFVPVYIGGNGDMLAFRAMLRRLYKLIDPTRKRTFRLVGESAEGSRELVVTYLSGLEGADDAAAAGLSWAKVGINFVAHTPFAQARADRVLEFRHTVTPEPFLGVVGGTDAPFPRALVTASVIGTGMRVTVDSEVPVYPTIELLGPMDSFAGELSPIVVDENGVETTIDDQEWAVSIPAGVTAGSTFRAVTDPRYRSFRLNGALAAGRIALGSRLRPFYPGSNTLDVTAPGSTENTIIRFSWRDQFWSLW